MKNSKWIWTDDSGYNLVNSWVQARKVFQLKNVPNRAVIGITADSQYRLYLNGKYVNRGPARGFQESWPYDSVDIAQFLRKGKNIIAVLVHNYGIGNYQYIHKSCAGLLVWGKIGNEDISTGKEWKIRLASCFKTVLTRTSKQSGFQEHFDARFEDNWMSGSYGDSNWSQPHCMDYGSMPWPKLEQRGIPLLKEEIIFPKTLASKASGKCAKDYKNSVSVVELYSNEEQKWLSSDESENTAALKIVPSGKDKFISYCIDFGKEVVGSIRLSVAGGAGNEIIDTIVSESINGSEPVILGSKFQGSRVNFGNRLFLRKGKTKHEQFDYWGFRYLVIIIRNSAKTLNINVSLRSVGYPMEIKSEFKSSDSKLNSVYEISSWTQQCCMLDAYVDCPWREQAQWWGDARVQGKNTFYLSADARLFARGIKQIGTQQLENGLLYGHAPTIAHHCILPDFTLTWILTHWDYYWQTGDLALFKSMKDNVHKTLNYFQEVTAKNGLLPHDKRYWLFMDWAGLFDEGYPTLYNLFYLVALEKVVKLFKLSGDNNSVKLYSKRMKTLKSAIEKRLYNKGTKKILAGLFWNDKPATQSIPHNYALAIIAGLFPEHHDDFARKQLLPLIKGEREHPVLPSPFFMFYIFEALKKCGYNKEVVDCIRRWWGDMVDRGLTTTEELWNAKAGDNSLCHAWSAHPIVHLSDILLGINQEKPGWKEISFSPEFSDLEYARGKVATPLGVIESGWEKIEAGRYKTFLKLPKGITVKKGRY
ncbi:MAG: hypothetical protein A3J83_02180 [Elusimicrobia bacterium RIFOXYA2_FULL_40_6]|nr:MAG: hypothetical protein A3J83_02180 [Elusimicrobia bacterium RIFOXYA2_FULL_40_6]